MTKHIWLLALLLLGPTAADAVAQESCASNSATGTVQGWTDHDRWGFYHKDQGAPLMPLGWYQALEVLDTNRMFKDILEGFNIIPDCPGPYNPYGLPVGLTVLDVDEDPVTYAPRKEKERWVGFTCAFCHTHQLKYYDKNNALQSIRIDGGSSMQQNYLFGSALVASIGVTVGLPPGQVVYFPNETQKPPQGWMSTQQCEDAPDTDQFTRFATRVGAKDKKALRQRLCEFYTMKTAPRRVAAAKHIELVPDAKWGWGYGVLDAFGRAGNTILTNRWTHPDPKDRMSNLVPMNAPVNIPYIWGALDYQRMQWTGSVSNPVARSTAETIGVGAPLKFSYPAPSGEGSQSSQPSYFEYKTINPKVLLELEVWTLSLKRPEWPAAFPAIEKDKAQRGKFVYADKCANCHTVRTFNQFGIENMIEVDRIGTDKMVAESLFTRRAKPGNLKPMMGDAEEVDAVKVVEYITTELLKDFKRVIGTSDGRHREITEKMNQWIAKLEYIARPLDGVWATPPYLHNGSIPNLYLLLSPEEVRDRQAETFCIGALIYDPVYVGFKTNVCTPQELEKDDSGKDKRFDTRRAGYSNSGHEFRNDDRKGHVFSESECLELARRARAGILGCELEEHERWEIIEYLKTSLEPLTVKEALSRGSVSPEESAANAMPQPSSP